MPRQNPRPVRPSDGLVRLARLFWDRKLAKSDFEDHPRWVVMSLTYLEDAEEEPMPEMLVSFDWEECTTFFVREARMVVLPP